VPTRPTSDARKGCAADRLLPVIGHRGAAARAPENTCAGLRRARALGCRWVEFDVRLTGDGELILLHDERLERTTNGRGKVRAQPLAAIRRCDAGAWFAPCFAGEPVPTLAEAIAVLAEEGLGANVELKAARSRAAATGAAAADLLSRLWPPELPGLLISSFLPEALMTARDHAPAIARGLLCGAIPRDWRARAERLGCVTINADHRRLRPAAVAEIRQLGYSVLAYTVNDAARARELFAWGVTSVFSDVPDLILAETQGASRSAASAGAGATPPLGARS
jgi:glycerophosphoryl diester phosphodiesterase